MKMKFMLMVAAAMMVFGYSVQAFPSVTTNFSQLSVGIVVITNAAPVVADNVTTWATGQAKVGNKELLMILSGANFANTAFPYGAQLVVGWDAPWNGDVLVVDKSGTNVLYDASTDSAEHFRIDFFNLEGAFKEIDNENNPGYIKRSGFNKGYFEFEDDAGNTFISGSGPSGDNFSQKWDASHNFTYWTDKIAFTFNGAGSSEKLNNESNVTVVGQITAKGGGVGENTFLN